MREEVHWESHGSGRPVVVLHGIPLDHRYVQASLEPIFEGQSGWRRMYLDLPGHGATPASGLIRTGDQLVEALCASIEAQIPKERFTLVGLSYGAYLARGIVGRIGDRVNGLFLWVPAHYPREDRRKVPRAVLLEDPTVAAEAATDLERQFFRLLVVQNRAGLTAIRNLVVPAATLQDEAFAATVSSAPFAVRPERAPFHEPTLIVCGRQDSLAGYLDAWDLLDAYPRATFAVLDGAGHFLGSSEEVDLFRALVTDWLQRVIGA